MNIETMTRKELAALRKNVDQRIKQIDLESKTAEGVTTLEFLGTETEMHELKIKSVDRKPEKVLEMFQNWQKAEKWLEPPEMNNQIHMGTNGPPSTLRKETLNLNPGHHIGLASSIEDIVHADELDLWKQVVPEVGIQDGMVSLIYRMEKRKIVWTFDYNEFRTIMQKWLPRYVKIFFFTGEKNSLPDWPDGSYPVIFNPVGTDLFVVMAPRVDD